MDDPDIMDVTAMGQVNLIKESTLILSGAQKIGEEKRSCGEILYVFLHMMRKRINSYVEKHNLNVPPVNLTIVMSIALQERMKYLISKLILPSQHRNTSHKINPLYKTVDDVKAKLKILQDIDQVQENREKERQKQIILKTAASRSKSEDPEQAKMKEKAKAIQKAEQDALLYNQANITALRAIGQRKVRPSKSSLITINNKVYKIQNPTGQTLVLKSAKRVRRITMKDMLFLLESEPETAHSTILYRSYYK